MTDDATRRFREIWKELGFCARRDFSLSLGSPKESIAIATAFQAKAAALFYDRIWWPLDLPGPPFGMRAWGGYAEEPAWSMNLQRVGHFTTDPNWRAQYGDGAGAPTYGHWKNDGEYRVYASRSIATELCKKGLPATAVYGSQAQCDAEFKQGGRAVLTAVLSNCPVIDAEALTWEQVGEVRSDADSRRKLLRLAHWVDTDMLDRSHEYVADEICLRLENYTDALKKHGARTKLGAISSVLDVESLGAAAAVLVGLTASGSPFWGAVTGSIVLAGRAVVEIKKAMLDLDDVKRGEHSEVAAIYELAQQSEKAIRRTE